MRKLFDVVSMFTELIVTIIILFLLTLVKIIDVRQNFPDIIFYLIPLGVSFIKNIKVIKNYTSKLTASVKSLFLQESVFWEFIGDYHSKDLIDIRHIFECVEKYDYECQYKKISFDIFDFNRVLINLDGLRMDIKSISTGNGYEYSISFSSESSLRAYRKKHEKYIIKPYFKQIETTFNKKLVIAKYTIIASKILIHDEIIKGILSDDLERDYDIIKLKATYKRKDNKDTVIQISDSNFACTSTQYAICCDSFQSYAYGQL